MKIEVRTKMPHWYRYDQPENEVFTFETDDSLTSIKKTIQQTNAETGWITLNHLEEGLIMIPAHNIEYIRLI